jgi:hypothetical protein
LPQKIPDFQKKITAQKYPVKNFPWRQAIAPPKKIPSEKLPGREELTVS